MEFSREGDSVVLRNAAGTVLSFTIAEWELFRAAVKAGEFDDPESWAI